jgi:hypothetical protein
VPVLVESVRREWEEGYRRFESASRDAVTAERLRVQLEAVMDELRRRVGQTFTLSELAVAYHGAERWTREAVGERAPVPGWPRTLAMVEDTAFYLYQRGAVDYAP